MNDLFYTLCAHADLLFAADNSLRFNCFVSSAALGVKEPEKRFERFNGVDDAGDCIMNADERCLAARV